jgi:hypothetical protein
MTRWLRLVSAALLLAGCARSDVYRWSGGGQGGSTDGDTAADTDVDSDSDSDGDSDTGSVPEDCVEGALLVYVVSHDGRLYSLDPSTEELELIGEVDCAVGGANVFSMAVAREGIAYILYYEQNTAQCAGMWAVDVFTAECLGQTDFDCDNPEGFALSGMGFATDGEDTVEETLYLARGWGGADPWLAALDTDTWEVDPIATLEMDGELAGNGAGELWGFFVGESPKQLGRIDKASGEISDTIDLDPLTGDGGSAIAFWGGDFYVFWSFFDDSGTIYRVTTDGEVESFKDIGFLAVGAGSSTCAPIED